MKLIEVFTLCVLCVFFSEIFASSFLSARKAYDSSESLQLELESDTYVLSFVKQCAALCSALGESKEIKEEALFSELQNKMASYSLLPFVKEMRVQKLSSFSSDLGCLFEWTSGKKLKRIKIKIDSTQS